jgi:hypothetical protein
MECDIIEHCEVNGYLFDKWGNFVHQKVIKNKEVA